MEVLARFNNSWSAGGDERNDSGVASSKYCRIESIAVRDTVRHRERRRSESPRSM